MSGIGYNSCPPPYNDNYTVMPESVSLTVSIEAKTMEPKSVVKQVTNPQNKPDVYIKTNEDKIKLGHPIKIKECSDKTVSVMKPSSPVKAIVPFIKFIPLCYKVKRNTSS